MHSSTGVGCASLMFQAVTRGQQGRWVDQCAAVKAHWEYVHAEYHRLRDEAASAAVPDATGHPV